MKIIAIVAAAENGVIGEAGEIPWYLQEDFKFFKKTTLGHHIIMGRKTFDSIGKPLPKRRNIVLTRNPFFLAAGVLATDDLTEALQIAETEGAEQVFIIGGGTIYEQSLPLCDAIYYTEVATTVSGDTFFPKLDPETWTKTPLFSHQADEKNDFDFTVFLLERIKV
jgi:dihydrofolate reductase